MNTLPKIKNAVTGNDFNDTLFQMLQAAGPMKLVTTPPPDTLPLELRRNINFEWFNDPVLRNDVKEILDTIKNNFRRHPVCWINDDPGGYLLSFPFDDPIINSDISTNYPDEFSRLMIIFRYWNILNFFNPYNYILDNPWDSTLFNNILSVANASNYLDFKMTFMKMKASLNDAHAEGFTSHFTNLYVPRIVLRYSQGNYIVVKSGYPEIVNGDIIVSVDGKTTINWEDSLRPYISAGNPNVFRRQMCLYMLRGTSGSKIEIEYTDSLENVNNLSASRDSFWYRKWFSGYYPNDSLATVKWKKWDCNIGYVHMGNLLFSDLTGMYNDLKNTKAIIFDIRNYPNRTLWELASLLYPNPLLAAKYLYPDLQYPGTYFWKYQYLGSYGNPSYYKGKVIILCNQQTQSQAEYTCMVLRVVPNSVVVGSQTAGTDGDLTVFKISQNFLTGFTTLGWFYPDGTQTQRIGIVPDSVVYITHEGIRRGRDEVLEKAIKIAGCDTTTAWVIDLNPLKNKLIFYPNPAKDNITISLSNNVFLNMHISIFNSLGIQLKQFNVKELSGKSSISFSTEPLPAGVYYCTLNDGIKKVSRRFVVVK